MTRGGFRYPRDEPRKKEEKKIDGLLDKREDNKFRQKSLLEFKDQKPMEKTQGKNLHKDIDRGMGVGSPEYIQEPPNLKEKRYKKMASRIFEEIRPDTREDIEGESQNSSLEEAFYKAEDKNFLEMEAEKEDSKDAITEVKDLEAEPVYDGGSRKALEREIVNRNKEEIISFPIHLPIKNPKRDRSKGQAERKDRDIFKENIKLSDRKDSSSDIFKTGEKSTREKIQRKTAKNLYRENTEDTPSIQEEQFLEDPSYKVDDQGRSQQQLEENIAKDQPISFSEGLDKKDLIHQDIERKDLERKIEDGIGNYIETSPVIPSQLSNEHVPIHLGKGENKNFKISIKSPKKREKGQEDIFKTREKSTKKKLQKNTAKRIYKESTDGDSLSINQPFPLETSNYGLEDANSPASNLKDDIPTVKDRQNITDKNPRPKFGAESNGHFKKDIKSPEFEDKKGTNKKKIQRFQKALFEKREGYDLPTRDEEIYDPLSKDMDNDGVIDRYDMDFRDSRESYRLIDDDRTHDKLSLKEESKANRFKSKSVFKVEPSTKASEPSHIKKKRYMGKNNFSQSDLKKDKLGEEASVLKEKEIVPKRRQNYNTEEFTRDKNKAKKNLNKGSSEKQDSQIDEKSSEMAKEEKLKEKKSASMSRAEKSRKDKFKKKEEKISKLYKKDEKLNSKLINQEKKSKGGLLNPVIVASSMTANYLYSGKEDNAGVSGAYKVSRTTEMAARKLRHNRKKKAYQTKKKLTKLSGKIKREEEKISFLKNYEELKKTEGYMKSSRLNRFFMKKNLQRQFRKKHEANLMNRLKENLTSLAKKTAEVIKQGGYKKILALLCTLILFAYLFQIGSNLLGLTAGVASNIMTTNYLSTEGVLSEVNQEFSSYEYALQAEIDDIESYHPGYDEYQVKGDSVGHEVHELFSYLTAKHGEIKSSSEIRSELKALFNKMYKKEYETQTITKYNDDGEAYDYRIFILTIKKKTIDEIAREEFKDKETNLAHYEALLEAGGNMTDLFGSGNYDEIINNPNFGNPGIAFDDETVQKLFNEAEKHIGKKYVYGANGPNNFDCSSFVAWSFRKSGVKNIPRTTAWGIYKDYCNPISASEAKAGDIIFFKGTYNAGRPISHVGIYAGNGMMIHAGDPIQYASINTNYWKKHFYGFGRPR